MTKRTLRWIHAKFLFSILLFLILLALALLAGYLSFWYFNPSIAFAIVFALLLVFLFGATMFRSRLEALINRSYLIRIGAHQGPPLPIKRIRNVESLERYLRTQDFSVFARQGTHTVMYRLKRDDIKRIFRGYILEVVVYLQPSVEEFYLDHVDECVRKLQQEAAKNKQKVEKILITQIKKVDQLTDQVKQQIKEVIFLRSQSGVISTINVGLDDATDKAVFLYAEGYTPSMYYTYHIEQIKRML